MPPKTSQKRSRESTGTATRLPAGAATAAVAAPGSVPLLRRGRSSSVTSQEEGNADNDGAPRPKRSRREKNLGRESGASDASMGEEDMDEEGEERMEEQDVVNGRDAIADASSKRSGAAKKSAGGRRRASAATAAVGGGGLGEAGSSNTAQPPPGKRSRKSTGSSATTTARAAAPMPVLPPGSKQVDGIVPGGDAGHAIPPPGVSNGTPREPVANGRHSFAPGSRPVPTSASASSAAVNASGVVGMSGKGMAAERGRPPLAVSAPRAQGRGRGGRAPLAAPGRPSAGAAAGVGAGMVVRSSANGGVVAQASPAARAEANSPVRGVSPSILRRITGSAEESPDGTLGDGGGGDATGVIRPWRAAMLRGKAWAMGLGGCVPEIDIGATLPAVQRLTLRCLLLLVMLLGARVVWTVTLMATGMGSGLVGGSGGAGGDSGVGGGQVQGGATRREAALSLVLESEGFRSLEGALVERERHLAGMQEQDEHARAALEGLRGLVRALDSQMELLRDQAAGGVASRGLPDDPQVSESVSLSQLAEVRGMEEALKTLVDATSEAVEEGQKWTDSAVEDLDKLASSSPSFSSSSSPSSTQRREAAAEATQTWDADFVRTFEAAFLSVESVIAGADRVEEMGARKPGAKDGARFARHVQEAALAAAASGEGWGEDLQQRVEDAVAEEIRQAWEHVETAGEDTSSPSPSRVLKTAQEAEDLVAHEIEIFSSGGTGMPDYASLIPGASVVYGPLMSPDGTEGKLTSPTLASTMLPWADYVLHLLRMPGRVYAEDGDAALSTSNSLGSCFAFQGGDGRLTVKLARPPAPAADPAIEGLDAAEESAKPPRGFVKVTHVSIEHARAAYAPSATKSAPRAFRVLGWDEDPSAAVASTSGFGRIGGGNGNRSSGTALRPYVLVEGMEYLAGGNAPGVQTFAVTDESRLLAPPVGWVTLEVQSNHGGKWTCVYGFRVHGDPVV